jgi:O-succinylbenzoic acid--CoA ligase
MVFPAEDLIKSAQLTERTFGLKRGDRALLCLPCSFIAGRMMLVRAFVTGLDLHVMGPSGDLLEHLPPNDRFVFTPMVPLQLQRMLDADAARVASQFGTILLGGGPVSQGLIDAVRRAGVRAYHGYGSTETLTHVALRDLSGSGRDDAFKAIGYVHFSITPDDRLIVHTPHLSIREHRTTDIVALIDERNFRWLGRADHVILTGGKKIFPEELEARTAGTIPFPYFFTGEPDGLLGQRVVLVVEKAGISSTEEARLNHALEQVLSKHERPKRIVALRSFQRTTSGKVIRVLER